MEERDLPGIRIPDDVAAAEAVPDDLDADALGAYVFPSPRRRRWAAGVYFVAALAAAIAPLAGLPSRMLVVAAALTLIGAWHLATAWPLRVDETVALDKAAGVVSFSVGHASAAVRFEGWRSRPMWNVLLYSSDEPPQRRGLVIVDAVDGSIAHEPFEEALHSGDEANGVALRSSPDG